MYYRSLYVSTTVAHARSCTHVPHELLLVSIRRFDVVVAIINDVEGP